MNLKVFILSLFLIGTILVTFTPTATLADSAPAVKEQTASGKITAIDKDSFSIVTAAGKSLDFVTNADTVVEGKLAEEASAQVTYRVQDGANIAVRVVVGSES